MKCSTVVMTMGFALSLLACQETKEDLKNPVSEKEIYKTIGEEIPFETGMKWIEFYQEKNSNQGREKILFDYMVSNVQMDTLLHSVTDLVGVAFHYAIDSLGVKHILLIPVDDSLSLWSSRPGRVFVDANTGTEISQDVAYAWAQNYKDANPTRIWFHFFGKNIFDEMTALPYFNSIDIEPAINILNLKPQLLLIIWNDALITNGRTTDDPATVYDASNACPPCAVH